jgi:hypothetical protein
MPALAPKLRRDVRGHRAITLMTSVSLIIFIVLVTANNVTAQEATSTSITLTWTAPGDDGTIGTALQYDIRYAAFPITDANWEEAVQVDGEPAPQPAGSAEAITVEGLSSGTTYHFAIKAADEVPNWSVLSNVVSRQTLDEEIPPAVIADLAAGNATAVSITLTWTAPGDDGSSGTASVYDIRYSTSPITDANWDGAVQVDDEPSPQTAGSNESFTVGGLNPDTTYYFVVKTADEVPNWSGLSNVSSASTIDNIPPAAIDDLAAIEINLPGGIADSRVMTSGHYILNKQSISI